MTVGNITLTKPPASYDSVSTLNGYIVLRGNGGDQVLVGVNA